MSTGSDPNPVTASAACPAPVVPPAAPQAALRGGARRVATWLLLVALLVVGLWAGRWGLFQLSHSVTRDAFVATDLIELAPRVPGQIVEMLVQDNQSVPAGTLLCRVDPAPYRRQVAEDEATLQVAVADRATAQAALERLEQRMPAEIEVAKELLAVAESDRRSAAHSRDQIRDTVDHGIATAEQVVKSAEAIREFAQVTFARWDELARSNAVALEDRDAKQRQLRTAVADHEEALVRLEQAKSDRLKVDIAGEVLAAAERRVVQAQAQLTLAQLIQLDIDEGRRRVEAAEARVKAVEAERDVHALELAYTEVTAPFDAVVARRFQFEGDWAAPGVPIFSLYSHDNLYVTANMPETRLAGVVAGAPAQLDVDAFDRPFTGRVLWVGRATGSQFALVPRDLTSGEFTKVVQRVPIRILIDRDQRWPLLSPGLSVTVSVAHDAGDDVAPPPQPPEPPGQPPAQPQSGTSAR